MATMTNDTIEDNRQKLVQSFPDAKLIVAAQVYLTFGLHHGNSKSQIEKVVTSHLTV